MPKPEAPKNTYWRGPVLWARYTIAGATVRTSLHTSSSKVAARRVAELIERDTAARRFGEVVMTWDSAVNAWADHIVRQVGIRTAARYSTSLEQCLPYLEGLAVHSVDRKAINALVTARRQTVGNATIKRDLTAVSSVLEFAISQGWAEANPARVVARTITERRDPIVLPQPESIALLMARANELWRGLIMAARLTGLRQDELCSIRRRDLNDAAATLYVHKAKGNRPRMIDLTPEAVQVLAMPPASASTECLFHFKNAPIRNPSERFRHMVERTQKAAQRAGLGFRPFTFHDLRHLYAVEYLQAGGSIYRLQQQMGHSSTTTTEGYLRFLTPEQAAKAKR
jgi:integrase/recombinase XerD